MLRIVFALVVLGLLGLVCILAAPGFMLGLRVLDGLAGIFGG